LAFVYRAFQSVVIWLSVVNFLISSLPQLWESDLLALEILENITIAIFTLDYIARLVTVEPSKRWKWIINPMHIFDVVVIIPFYIELIIKHGIEFNPADDSVLVIVRALRLFQMFRTVKIARYSSLIPIFWKALVLSKDGFVLFTFTVTILMVVVSAIFFYSEQTVMKFDHTTRNWVYPNGDLSSFQSIPATFWWFMATITTVGYGDVYPRSDLGKLIASITMVGGLFVLAVPVAVFGSNFNSVWEERAEQRKLKERKLLLNNIRDMEDKEILVKLEGCVRKFTSKLAKHKEMLDKLVDDEKEIFELMAAISKKFEEESRSSENTEKEMTQM